MSKLHSGRVMPRLCCALLTAAGALATAAYASERTENAAGVSEPSAVSALADYQPWQEVAPLDWRAANQRVREVGGWRVYLREASPGDPNEGMRHGH